MFIYSLLLFLYVAQTPLNPRIAVVNLNMCSAAQTLPRQQHSTSGIIYSQLNRRERERAEKNSTISHRARCVRGNVVVYKKDLMLLCALVRFLCTYCL